MRSIVFIVTALIATISFAGVGTATIEKIMLHDGTNLIYICPEGGVPSPPSCHSAPSYDSCYTLATSRSMANEYLSVLVDAKLSAKPVSFWGKGACNDRSDRETLDYFSL